MIAKKYITTLSKEEARMLVKRWVNMRASCMSIDATVKRLGITYERLSLLAKPWGISFSK